MDDTVESRHPDKREVVMILSAMVLMLVFGAFMANRQVEQVKATAQKEFEVVSSRFVKDAFENAGYRVRAVKTLQGAHVQATCMRRAGDSPVRCDEIPNLPVKTVMMDRPLEPIQVSPTR